MKHLVIREIRLREINTLDVDSIEKLHRRLISSFQLFEKELDIASIERFVSNQKIPKHQIE